MSKTSIEWSDFSWNPIRGTKGRHHCVRISEGCKHCYAATMNHRFNGPDYVKGADTPRLDEGALIQPGKWRRNRRIFVCSMTDLFMDEHSDEVIDAVFGVMWACLYQGNAAGDTWDGHTFQVLTKRAKRMREYLSADRREAWAYWAAAKGGGECGDGIFDQTMEEAKKPHPRIWLGVSAENRERADERIPDLRATPAAVRFVSAEPLLEDLGTLDLRGIHLVIVGGESGHGARRFDVAWPRRIKAQCRKAGTAFFMKQMGAFVVDRNDAGFEGDPDDSWDIEGDLDRVEHDLDGTRDDYQGAPVRIHLKDKKGGDPEEWPADLRVREMPR